MKLNVKEIKRLTESIMIKDSSCHFGIDKALDTVANLTEISGSKLDVKKTGVAIITSRPLGIMAEPFFSNFGKGGKISERFFQFISLYPDFIQILS